MPATQPRSAPRPAARALRRRSQREVTADEESFTAALRHAIRSMASTQVTASSSLQALAAAADASARAALHTLNAPGRQRPPAARAESTPEIPPRLRDQDDHYRQTPGHGIRARLLIARGNTVAPGKGGTAPSPRGRGPWNRAPSPLRHAGISHTRA